jgi:Sulfotransferase domain
MQTEDRKARVRRRRRERPILERFRTGIPLRATRLSKDFYQWLVWPQGQWRSIGFIVGCQRSGTTLLTQLFDASWATKVFGEFSELSSADTRLGIRLNSLDDVAAVFGRARAPVIVLKPLVETQRVASLLAHFRASRAIFVYRDYRDVVLSNLKKFGSDNGLRNLEPIVRGDASNWRSEKVSDQVRDVVRRFYSTGMTQSDAAALFWYARNRLYFDLSLDHRHDVFLCRYEDLVSKPGRMMADLYRFLGWTGDVGRLPPDVHQNSISRGRDVELSPEILELCQQLLDSLNARCPERDHA